jgi:hypothetical protein
MPSGERSQTWYPELVGFLRSQWRRDLSWEDMVLLRDQLQRMFEDLRASRGIVPPTLRCWRCGTKASGAQPRISIRSMLISVRRFGIDADEPTRKREREWARHRNLAGLDLFGRPTVSQGDERGEQT